MPSLTRAEAARRAEVVRVHSYAVELDVTRPDEFVSRTVIEFAATAGETFAEVKGARELLATLNGRRIDAVDDRLALTGLEGENRLEVEFIAPYSRGGDGLHRFVDPE